jgi:subtilase family serine protease
MANPRHRLALGMVAAALITGLTALPAIAAGSGRTSLPGTLSPWATARSRRTISRNTKVQFAVVLSWRNADGLRSLIDRVSDPSSIAYGRYLTPAQFHAAYSPTADSASRVASWLRGQGFAVGTLPANRMFVPATGTVAQVEAAFETTLRMYRAYGKDLRAPTKALSIPSSLSGNFAGVVGVDDSYKLRHSNAVAEPDVTPAVAAPNAEQPPVFYNAPPCSTSWGQLTAANQPPAYGQHQPWTECGLSPAQVRGAYGLNAVYGQGITGQGQTVAIIDAFASPTIVRDATIWSKRRGLVPPNITQRVFPPTAPVDPGWYGEETLDVEAVHAVAPGARILYVGGSDAGLGLDMAMNWIIDNAASHIISNSYGFFGEHLPSGLINFEQQTFMQGAAEGIGVYFSSGDDGDETVTLGSRQTDWPAGSDFVTAVGGTSLAVTSAKGYQFETYWGTDKTSRSGAHWSPAPPGDWIYGGGGGTSQVIAEPSWQQGVVPEQFSGHFGGEGRVVPDVSLVGDPNTGLEVGETQQHNDGSQSYSEYRIGGTSLSCPLMAGIMALADQMAGTPHGFANPALYGLAGTSAYRDVSAPASTVAAVRNDYIDDTDPTSGVTASLRTMGDVLTLSSVAGYDDSTGLGSIRGGTFVTALG